MHLSSSPPNLLNQFTTRVPDHVLLLLIEREVHIFVLLVVVVVVNGGLKFEEIVRSEIFNGSYENFTWYLHLRSPFFDYV